MQHQPTFTLRPTPGLKGCYDILRDGKMVSQGFGRADMKRELRAYQMGFKKVQVVSEQAAAVADWRDEVRSFAKANHFYGDVIESAIEDAESYACEGERAMYAINFLNREREEQVREGRNQPAREVRIG